MKRICKYCGKEYDGDPGSSCCPDCAAAQRATTLRPRTCRQCGVTFDGGITDYDLQEASLKSLICDHASKVYLVAHSEKFGVNAFSFSCPLDRVDVIITDPNLPKEYADQIREMGIELVFADMP